MKGVEADLWTGLFGPAQMPAAALQQLSSAVNETLRDGGYKAAEFKAGSLPAEPGDPASFRAYLQREELRLRPVLANIKAE